MRDYLEQRRNPTSMQLMAPLGGVVRPRRVVRLSNSDRYLSRIASVYCSTARKT
jgi:hypothetical protein